LGKLKAVSKVKWSDIGKGREPDHLIFGVALWEN
jgi:hypothetical protein